MGLIDRCRNWSRFIGGEIRTLPRYWKRHTVNILMGVMPDDELSAVFRAKLLGLFGYKIGKGAMIRQSVRLGGAKLIVGSCTSIGACCHLDCHDAEIIIGSHVAVSPRVTIVTATHTMDGYPGRIGPTVCKPVVIKDGAWIGIGASILAGVTVGERSVVAAGSVVTHDVPDNTMVAGIPAKVVKYLDELDAPDNVSS